MFMKKKDAFTFVELIFTISIMAFIGLYAIFYFNSYIDSKRIETEILLLKNDISDLDRKIYNKDIYNYELDFFGDYYYTYKLDNLYNPYKLNFLFDYTTKSFTCSTSETNTGSWNLKIYAWNKNLYNKILLSTDTFTWRFDNYKNYYIVSTLSWNTDEMWFSYFSEDNLDSSWSLLKLITTNNVTIINKNKKIELLSWSTVLSNIDLIFEKNWIQKSLNFKVK